jgi:membrane-bound serine protease (ClpP class)
LVGKIGVAETDLRPSGSVSIDDELYDSKAVFGFIEKGSRVKVTKYETTQVYVIKEQSE